MPESDPKPQPAPQQTPPQPLELNVDLAGLEAPENIGEDPDSHREQKQVFGDKRRKEQLKQFVHEALLKGLRLALLCFMAVFAVRVLHFILPENNSANAGTWIPHGWLTEHQLGSIDKFAAGALGTILAQFIKNLVAKDSDSSLKP